ncbi:hypothetical protein AB4Y40_41675 [Paraburkholderia sp. EG287B]|uniref:hypothetical protein n=1 Tax=Paraburkholderia sp. EG287B TaxID=3237010 RepID=UPI0034D2CE43
MRQPRARKTDVDPELTFFGLHIQRKTDILALTAFVISLLTGGLQIVEWYKGPQISLYSPERVVIYTYMQTNGLTVIRVAAQMSYTNTASAQYAGSIKSEQVTLTIGPLKSVQKWLSFAQLRREGEIFDPKILADAAPFPIPGGGSISHSTLFSAFPVNCKSGKDECDRYRNYISGDDFLKALGAKTIELKFQSDVYAADGVLSAGCKLTIDKFFRTTWLANRSFTASCESPSPEEMPFDFWQQLAQQDWSYP